MDRSGYRTAADDPISIIVVDGDVPPAPSIIEINKAKAKHKRILIVEDNPRCLLLLKDVLEVRGYEILKTRKGLEAINLARDNRPDLILMDIRLPDISGLDATRLLKQDHQTKCIPIIAVTAFAMRGDKAKALESGCDAYMAKPITLDNLLRIIESFLSPLTPIGGDAL
jgi:two-component system cell cycle response regulator DivK